MMGNVYAGQRLKAAPARAVACLVLMCSAVFAVGKELANVLLKDDVEAKSNLAAANPDGVAETLRLLHSWQKEHDVTFSVENHEYIEGGRE